MIDRNAPQMATKNRHPVLILVAFAVFSGFVWLVFSMLGDNINYFKTPSLVTLADRQEARSMRLGGIVEAGSIHLGAGTLGASEIVFSITDGTLREKIRFNGVLPDLFREGQGVVVDGRFGADGEFTASRILAKHDENYMSTAPTGQFSLIDE